MGTVSIFDEKALNVVVDANEVVMDVLKLKTQSRYVYGGGKLKCYTNPHAFLSDLPKLPVSANFFFGTFYGAGSKLTGADLAEAVKSRDRSSPVFVVTTELDVQKIVEARRLGIVDAIFPKEIYFTEPHDNGQLTHEENKEFFSLMKIVSPDSDFKQVYAFLKKKRGQHLDEISRVRKTKTELPSEASQEAVVAEAAGSPKSSALRFGRFDSILGLLARLTQRSQ